MFAERISGLRLFARQNMTASCTDQQMSDDYAACRASAAETCSVPDPAITAPSDQCVCATLDGYNSKFLNCISTTDRGVYASCLDPNAEAILASLSSNHCTPSASTSSSPSSPPSAAASTTAPTPTPTPTAESSSPVTSSALVSIHSSNPPPISSAAASSVAASSAAVSSAAVSSAAVSSAVSTLYPNLSTPPASGSTLSPTIAATSKFIPGSSQQEPTPTSAAKPSSSPKETSKEKSTTTTPVPKPSFIPVTIAAVSASTTSSSTHSPVSNGLDLETFCKATVLLLNIPFWMAQQYIGPQSSTLVPTAAGTEPATITITIPVSTGASQQAADASGGFPVAVYPAQATLDRCPDNYQSVGDGCCPSNYLLWSTAFGGQTPCYSTLLNPLTPPPISDSITGTSTSSTGSPKPTSAIVNVVYAMQYPVNPPKTNVGLATAAKIGIGAGAGGAALIFGFLIFLLIWKHRTHKRDRAALESLSGFGPGLSSARQSAVTAVATTRSRHSAPSQEVAEWRQTVLPEVAPQQQRQYPADWTPSHASGSPPPPPGGRNGFVVEQQQAGLEPRFPEPPIPEPYPSRVELQGRPYPMTPPTELQTGQDFSRQGVQRQELQGQQWAPRYEFPAQRF